MNQRLLVSMVLALSLAGCGGGGGSGTSNASFVTFPGSTGASTTTPVVAGNNGSNSGGATSSPSSTPGSTSGTTQTAALILIQIPLNGNGVVSQANQRTPKYVSPNTQGVQIGISLSGVPITGSPFVYNVGTGGTCSIVSNVRTCSISIPVNAGTYTFQLDTYDTAPSGGVIPGTAKHLATASVTQQITPGASTSIAFLVKGVPSTYSAVNSGGTALSYQSFPADSANHNLGVIVQAVDGSGSTISGSNPYSTSIPVALSEAGGSGHTTLIIDGVSAGTSGALVSPADTLTVQYDGKGSSGYGAVLNLNGASTVTLSPMYLSSTSAALTSLTATTSVTISETNPSAVLYSASPGSACTGVTFTTNSVSGPASGATLTLGTTVTGGASITCPVTITDNYGTGSTFLMNFTAAGPIAPSTTVVFSPLGSGSGSCTGGGIQYTTTTPTATFAVADPNGTGLGAISGNTSIATVSLAGGNATVTAVASGSTTVTFTDAQGNSATCPISVTVANGSISSSVRKPAGR